MRRKLRCFGVMTLVLGLAVLGCTRPAVRTKDPGDPLLQTKKPVEGQQHVADGEPTHEVPPPPLPPHDPSSIGWQGQGSEPAQPVLLGVEPAEPSGLLSQGPTGR
jgi:hypothetical protein